MEISEVLQSLPWLFELLWASPQASRLQLGRRAMQEGAVPRATTWLGSALARALWLFVPTCEFARSSSRLCSWGLLT